MNYLVLVKKEKQQSSYYKIHVAFLLTNQLIDYL